MKLYESYNLDHWFKMLVLVDLVFLIDLFFQFHPLILGWLEIRFHNYF